MLYHKWMCNINYAHTLVYLPYSAFDCISSCNNGLPLRVTVLPFSSIREDCTVHCALYPAEYSTGKGWRCVHALIHHLPSPPFTSLHLPLSPIYMDINHWWGQEKWSELYKCREELRVLGRGGGCTSKNKLFLGLRWGKLWFRQAANCVSGDLRSQYIEGAIKQEVDFISWLLQISHRRSSIGLGGLQWQPLLMGSLWSSNQNLIS